MVEMAKSSKIAILKLEFSNKNTSTMVEWILTEVFFIVKRQLPNINCQIFGGSFENLLQHVTGIIQTFFYRNEKVNILDHRF